MLAGSRSVKELVKLGSFKVILMMGVGYGPLTLGMFVIGSSPAFVITYINVVCSCFKTLSNLNSLDSHNSELLSLHCGQVSAGNQKVRKMTPVEGSDLCCHPENTVIKLT